MIFIKKHKTKATTIFQIVTVQSLLNADEFRKFHFNKYFRNVKKQKINHGAGSTGNSLSVYAS